MRKIGEQYIIIGKRNAMVVLLCGARKGVVMAFIYPTVNMPAVWLVLMVVLNDLFGL